MAKVFDCFTFFNEVELLEFRCKFLNDSVDYFVIAESNLTHSGKSKPYYFQNAIERFQPWLHKIIYIPVEQTTEGLLFKEEVMYNPKSAAWQLENNQRNALLQAANKMDANDVVLLSDLDEIPDPAAIQKVLSMRYPIAFSLLFHYYYLNGQNIGESRWWKGCIACTANQFIEITPQGLRNKRDAYPSVSKGGWHFSFLGGVQMIQQKIKAFAHTEFNKDEFVNEQQINEALSKGTDLLKREGVIFKFVPLSYYPVKLQKVMKQYPALLHIKTSNPFLNLYYTIRRIVKGNY